jgi:23S rRNA (pseudouridine1915-N3)-methyltransferase
MRVRLIAVGARMPRWVDEVFADYARRGGSKLRISLIEVAPGVRGAGREDKRAVELEGARVLSQLRADDFVVVLDERGRQLSTRELAQWLHGRMLEGRDLSFVIGGPDGLAEQVRARGDFTWSLSQLTLPHALARVLVAEQLYRAHTVLTGHPYHRD